MEKKTEDLLAGKLKFDNDFWLNYLFYDDIKKLDENQY